MKSVRHWSYLLFKFTPGVLLFFSPVEAFKRTVGPANNIRFENASRACNGSDPNSFKFGACSALISCVYPNLSEALKASLNTGTSIVSLLPTILALIGESSF